MRTTLDLDDDLVAALATQHPGLTKTEAIELAIRSYVEHAAVDCLRRRAGSMEIVDLSDERRRWDRHT